jgi:integrase/recombinase XerD
MNIELTPPYKEFLEPYTSEATRRDYAGDFKMFDEYLKSLKKPLLNANSVDLEGYIAWLRDRKMADISIRRRIAPIRKLYEYLLNTEQIKKNPTLMLSRIKFDPIRKRKKALSPEDRKKLLESLDWVAQPRESLAILLGYHCGMRLFEIQKVAWFDFKDGVLTVKGKGNKYREVPVSSLLAKKLDGFSRKEDKFFNVSKDAIAYWIKKKFKSLGIKGSPHSLRHTFCSELIEKGIQITTVCELAGHRNIQTTMGYILVDNKAKENAIQKVFG